MSSLTLLCLAVIFLSAAVACLALTVNWLHSTVRELRDRIDDDEGQS